MKQLHCNCSFANDATIKFNLQTVVHFASKSHIKYIVTLIFSHFVKEKSNLIMKFMIEM